MLTQLRRRLPEWKVCRRSEVSEYYFNVTVMRHGSERTTSFPFPASANGRHLITTRWSGWTILNTHAESGSRLVERDARESQLLHMSRSHECEEQGQLCVLAGDLNLRVGEERDLQREGWRDAWSSPPGVDDWTWCRGSSTARYDRVFLHDAGEGESAECAEIRRLTGVWPALSDHVALHAVVRRRSKVQVVPDEASSPATRQAVLRIPRGPQASLHLHRRPQATEHVRLPQRHQALLQLHRQPPTKQHLRLPHRPQALLQLPRRPQAKRHAHSGRAPAPMLPRRRPPMLGRCPLWPLATLSCSAPRRCATRA